MKQPSIFSTTLILCCVVLGFIFVVLGELRKSRIRDELARRDAARAEHLGKLVEDAHRKSSNIPFPTR